MTKVIITKNKNKYVAFEIKGHSSFSNPGTDIVCAGISSLVFGSINTLDQLGFKGKLDISKDSANIKIVFSEYDKQLNDFQIVLLTLEIGLKTISDSYPRNLEIAIKENNESKI